MTEDLFGIVGTVVASAYHVESVVAEGGFGVVYRARHGGFRAPVALKCLKVPQHLGGEHQTRFLEQFRAEAELMFRLSASTSTVTRPLHVDVMTTPNGSFVPFMVLEWLEGETLDAQIQNRRAQGKRPLGLPEVLELFEPVARALERAHHFKGPSGGESISHCDLKPENIFVALVGGERVVKILDFGVAKVRGAVTLAAKGSSNEVALFTPAYGAPEQWNPQQFGETGPWTDVWGLGLTLAETLTGRPVVVGDHLAVRAQILDAKRRPTPRSNGVIVSDRVEQVFARALAVDPRERYQDAGQFWKGLVDASGRAPEPSRASGPEIPDLVPLERKPSHPEIQAARGPVSFDFDDGDAAGGAALDLDLPSDEPRARRSLSPVGVPSVVAGLLPLAEAPTLSVDAPTSVPRPPPAPRAGVSLAPVTPRDTPRSEAMPPQANEAGGGSSPPTRSSAPSLSEEKPLSQRLVPGLALAGSSIVVTLLDRVYAAVVGEVFTLGPLHTSWIAAALLVGGLGLCAREALARS